MIEFSIYKLQEAAHKAETQLNYWLTLFGWPDNPRTFKPGAMAIVLNAAVEAGLVRLPDAVDVEARQQAYDKGYENGLAAANASAGDGEYINREAYDNARPILVHWARVMMGLKDEMMEAGRDGQAVGRITAEFMTLRSIFNLYDMLDDDYDHEAEAQLHASYAEPDPSEDLQYNVLANPEYFPPLDPDANANGHHAEPLPTPETYPDGAPRAKLDVDHLVDVVARQQEEAEWDWEDSSANLEALSRANPEPALSPAAVATLGPEHVTVTPLRSPVGVGRAAPDALQVERINKPRTVADSMPTVTHKAPTRPQARVLGKQYPAQVKGRNGNVLPTREEFVEQVKKISRDGVMPSKSDFDAERPTNWATAQAQLLRLKTTWELVREAAELQPLRPPLERSERGGE